MNPYLRFLLAILLSLFIHGTLLLSMQPHKKFPRQDEQGVLEVTFQNDSSRVSHPRAVEATLPANKKTEAKKKLSTAQSVQMPAVVDLPPAGDKLTQGRLLGQPPLANQQNQFMMAMQQAQLAHQRELRKAAVIAGLTNLSTQLRSVIKEKTDCVQQPDNQFECTPAQQEKVQILLKQFFDLALEAYSLGIAENPLRMDFGGGAGVSVTFLSKQ